MHEGRLRDALTLCGAQIYTAPFVRHATDNPARTAKNYDQTLTEPLRKDLQAYTVFAPWREDARLCALLAAEE